MSTLTDKDSSYWNNYYKNDKAPVVESSFARHVLGSVSSPKVVLDIGCGNGRDSAYFARAGHTVLSLDNSSEGLKKAQEISQNRVVPVLADASKLSITCPFVDLAYSRFSLHSMDQSSYLRCIKNVRDCLKDGGSFWIEVRSVSDELFEKGEKIDDSTYKTDHSRRFFNMQTLLNDLEKISFKIVFADEQKGWAVHGDDDPVVIRVCAVK